MAVREMTAGGFNFHAVFDNLPGWIQELDVEAIKRDAGIKPSPEQPSDSDVVNAAPEK